MVTACVGPFSVIGANIAGATILTASLSIAGAVDVPDMSTNAAGTFPVDPESGDFWHTFTDVSVNGYGPGLDLALTYNSVDAGATVSGMFGPGWTAFSSFSPSSDVITMADGSTIQLFSTYALPAYAAADASYAEQVKRFNFMLSAAGAKPRPVSLLARPIVSSPIANSTPVSGRR